LELGGLVILMSILELLFMQKVQKSLLALQKKHANGPKDGTSLRRLWPNPCGAKEAVLRR